MGQFEQAFQYIQEFTGFFTPGIVVLFLLGLFWPKMNANGALGAALGPAVFPLLLKVLWPSLPFIDRVGLVFLICLVVAVVASILRPSAQEQPKQSVNLAEIDFTTSTTFNSAAISLTLIIAALYVTWW